MTPGGTAGDGFGPPSCHDRFLPKSNEPRRAVIICITQKLRSVKRKTESVDALDKKNRLIPRAFLPIFLSNAKTVIHP